MSKSRDSNHRYANGFKRRELRRWLASQLRPCHICGLPIDYALPAGDPMAFEVDEIIPASRGGSVLDRLNVDAAHRCCNQWRGNRMTWDPAGAPTRNGGRGLPHSIHRRASSDAAACEKTGPHAASVYEVNAMLETSRSW